MNEPVLFKNESANNELKRLFKGVTALHLSKEFYYLHVMVVKVHDTTKPLPETYSDALDYKYLVPDSSPGKWPDRAVLVNHSPYQQPHKALCWRLFTQILLLHGEDCKLSSRLVSEIKKQKAAHCKVYDVRLVKINKDLLWEKLALMCGIFETTFIEHYCLQDSVYSLDPLVKACNKYNERIADADEPKLTMKLNNLNSLRAEIYSYVNHFSSMWSFYRILAKHKW